MKVLIKVLLRKVSHQRSMEVDVSPGWRKKQTKKHAHVKYSQTCSNDLIQKLRTTRLGINHVAKCSAGKHEASQQSFARKISAKDYLSVSKLLWFRKIKLCCDQVKVHHISHSLYSCISRSSDKHASSIHKIFLKECTNMQCTHGTLYHYPQNEIQGLIKQVIHCHFEFNA